LGEFDVQIKSSIFVLVNSDIITNYNKLFIPTSRTTHSLSSAKTSQ